MNIQPIPRGTRPDVDEGFDQGNSPSVIGGDPQGGDQESVQDGGPPAGPSTVFVVVAAVVIVGAAAALMMSWNPFAPAEPVDPQPASSGADTSLDSGAPPDASQ